MSDRFTFKKTGKGKFIITDNEHVNFLTTAGPIYRDHTLTEQHHVSELTNKLNQLNRKIQRLENELYMTKELEL